MLLSSAYSQVTQTFRIARGDSMVNFICTIAAQLSGTDPKSSDKPGYSNFHTKSDENNDVLIKTSSLSYYLLKQFNLTIEVSYVRSSLWLLILKH